MIVKCIREQDFKSDKLNQDFTVGVNYPILQLDLNNGHFLVTLKTDKNFFCNFESIDYFNIIDPRIPPNWIMLDLRQGYYKFIPKEFEEFEEDFWELCDGGDRAALQTLEKVYRELQIFHGIEPDPIPVEPVKEEHPFAWSDKWLHED